MIKIYQIKPQILLSILDSTLLIMGRSRNSERPRRHGFSDFERQKIRAHHQKHPGLLQSEVARWASDFLCRKINQSSILEILSDKFKQLDLAKLPRGQGLRERKRPGCYCNSVKARPTASKH